MLKLKYFTVAAAIVFAVYLFFASAEVDYPVDDTLGAVIDDEEAEVQGLPPICLLGTDVRETPLGTVDLSLLEYGLVYVDLGDEENLDVRLFFEGPGTTEESLNYGSRIYTGKGIYPLIYGSGEYTLTILVKNSGIKYSTVWKEEIIADFEDTEPFLYSNIFSYYTGDAALAQKAYEITKSESTEWEKAKAITEFVGRWVSYNYNLSADISETGSAKPSSYRKSFADDIYNDKSGICINYTQLTNAMLRAIGIPSREVWGYTDLGLYHAWSEVFVNGKWVIADSTIGLWDAAGYESILDSYR
jgi:transglutaminase-like putative cysteine protease